MTRSALVIANGEPPKKQLLQSLTRECSVVICADGGANIAFKFGILPDAIVGDMDSLHAEALVKFRKVPTYEDHGDESTDLEKAISWAIKKKYDHIVVIGASGKRLDHTVGNLGVLPKFYPDAVIRIVDDLGQTRYVGRELTVDAKRGDIVSLIPLSRCEGITTKGLRYALENEALELGVREGTSNVVINTPVNIKVKKGHLLFYKLFARP
ncbi:MAG: thiamine diphosphokinase [Ignavibacteria bacterium]|nr:thiamine diphosphokinase [Ignavibacteria bacterium]